jgi:hypothetical protein
VNDMFFEDAELARVGSDPLVLVHRHCDEEITFLMSALGRCARRSVLP